MAKAEQGATEATPPSSCGFIVSVGLFIVFVSFRGLVQRGLGCLLMVVRPNTVSQAPEAVIVVHLRRFQHLLRSVYALAFDLIGQDLEQPQRDETHRIVFRPSPESEFIHLRGGEFRDVDLSDFFGQHFGNFPDLLGRELVAPVGVVHHFGGAIYNGAADCLAFFVCCHFLVLVVPLPRPNKTVEATAIKFLVEVGVLRAVPHLCVRQRSHGAKRGDLRGYSSVLPARHSPEMPAYAYAAIGVQRATAWRGQEATLQSMEAHCNSSLLFSRVELQLPNKL